MGAQPDLESGALNCLAGARQMLADRQHRLRVLLCCVGILLLGRVSGKPSIVATKPWVLFSLFVCNRHRRHAGGRRDCVRQVGCAAGAGAPHGACSL